MAIRQPSRSGKVGSQRRDSRFIVCSKQVQPVAQPKGHPSINNGCLCIRTNRDQPETAGRLRPGQTAQKCEYRGRKVGDTAGGGRGNGSRRPSWSNRGEVRSAKTQ